MRTVIEVENLSKKFRIGKLRHDSGTLRDLFGNVIKYPFNRRQEPESETLWALRDVSFEVKQGEAFGIIGSNGAGKSTLLKVLSRIIKPTAGRARLDGRVGSLLEIGTGFHQDLTGRENIFLNGAVLGMRRREVEKKFDEIVAFADLEKFLETPVKFYSSGMYARLAFAVAAHLEPEILIIDEVLAVGDAAFQAKCLGKMGKVAEGGRTVLFVSHDAGSMTRLCKTGIYLKKGEVRKIGQMKDVMAQYTSDYESAVVKNAESSENGNALKTDEGKFVEWNVADSEAKIPHNILSGEIATLEFTFNSKRYDDNVNFRFIIKDLSGRPILSGINTAKIKEGNNRILWTLELPVKADAYKITAEAFSIAEQKALDVWECNPNLTVISNTSATDGELESLINIPTSFNVVHD